MPQRVFTLFPMVEKVWLQNLALNPSSSAYWLVISGSEDVSEVLSTVTDTRCSIKVSHDLLLGDLNPLPHPNPQSVWLCL